MKLLAAIGLTVVLSWPSPAEASQRCRPYPNAGKPDTYTPAVCYQGHRKPVTVKVKRHGVWVSVRVGR